MVTKLDDYLRENSLRYPLIPSNDIDDQRIQKSDWTRGTTGHTQTW